MLKCNNSIDFSHSMCSLDRIVAQLSWCSSVCPSVHLSVWPSGTGVHCDHIGHFSADLSWRFDSPMFRAPWHQSMSTSSQPSFPLTLAVSWTFFEKIFNQRRSVAKKVGCFRRNLFVCSLVCGICKCQHGNLRTSKHRMMKLWGRG